MYIKTKGTFPFDKKKVADMQHEVGKSMIT
jgi:hypothetical protein